MLQRAMKMPTWIFLEIPLRLSRVYFNSTNAKQRTSQFAHRVTMDALAAARLCGYKSGCAERTSASYC